MELPLALAVGTLRLSDSVDRKLTKLRYMTGRRVVERECMIPESCTAADIAVEVAGTLGTVEVLQLREEQAKGTVVMLIAYFDPLNHTDSDHRERLQIC